MHKTLSLHNYENCIVNLPNSILSKFGAPTVGKTLPLVDNLLKKDYKNVVILLLDGFGTCIMESNLKENGFLRTHFIESISTVFPPTTVAATTSVMSGLQPIEHAWLGWDCYYPQVDKRMQFEREFVEEFGKDFILLTKEDVYKEKLFGEGKPHKNVDEMIGDYVAIGITNLTIFNTREEADGFKTVHAGYTKDELLIPLIIFESKK